MAKFIDVAVLYEVAATPPDWQIFFMQREMRSSLERVVHVGHVAIQRTRGVESIALMAYELPSGVAPKRIVREWLDRYGPGAVHGNQSVGYDLILKDELKALELGRSEGFLPITLPPIEDEDDYLHSLAESFALREVG